MLEMIWKGGFMMTPLILCSIFMLAVILERRRSLEQLRIDLTPFRTRLEDLLRSGDIAGAVKLCDETTGPVAAVLGVGLRRYEQLRKAGRTDDVVESGVIRAMEDYAPHVIANLEKYLGVLATVGNIAPLFGFLGTVTGMIRSFQDIAAAGNMTPQVVASGISEALLTTAAGLMIAIPAFIAYNYYTTRVRRFVLDIEESSAHLIEAVIDQPRGGKDGAA